MTGLHCKILLHTIEPMWVFSLACVVCALLCAGVFYLKNNPSTFCGGFKPVESWNLLSNLCPTRHFCPYFPLKEAGMPATKLADRLIASRCRILMCWWCLHISPACQWQSAVDIRCCIHQRCPVLTIYTLLYSHIHHHTWNSSLFVLAPHPPSPQQTPDLLFVVSVLVWLLCKTMVRIVI